jgi:hypothetical protein
MAYVQWQIQAEHVALRQQLVERDVFRTPRQLLAQLPTIVIDDLHPEGLRLLLQIAPDATHPQDSQYFALGIMAQRRRFRLAPPLPLAEGEHARVEVAHGAQDQEHIHVGRGIVDGGGHVGDTDGRIALATSVHIDLIVSRPVVAEEPPGRREHGHQLGVEAAGDVDGGEGTVGDHHAVVFPVFALLDEFRAVFGRWRNQVRDVAEGLPRLSGTVSPTILFCQLESLSLGRTGTDGKYVLVKFSKKEGFWTSHGISMLSCHLDEVSVIMYFTAHLFCCMGSAPVSNPLGNRPID